MCFTASDFGPGSDASHMMIFEDTFEKSFTESHFGPGSDGLPTEGSHMMIFEDTLKTHSGEKSYTVRTRLR